MNQVSPKQWSFCLRVQKAGFARADRVRWFFMMKRWDKIKNYEKMLKKEKAK